MNIQHNLELGLEGEKWTSEALDRLEISHIHNDFSSLENYDKARGKGVDIRSNGWKFWMEVKHYPNSFLSTLEHYERLLEPRFESCPIEFAKFAVVIKGRIVKEWLVIPNRNGITIIHVEDPKYLDSKMEYYLRKEGIIKDKKRTIQRSLKYYISPGIMCPDGDEMPMSAADSGKGPPNLNKNQAQNGSSVNLG